MPKPFDATLKHLVETYPAHWLAQLGFPPDSPVQVVDADLSTVSAAADKVLRIEDPDPWLLYLELQASREAFLPRRLLRCNVLLDERHNLPVHSVLVLLRPEADARELTGEWRRQPPHGRSGGVWTYEVVRLWRQPVEPLLAGGLGVLPLVPLADLPRAELPAVIRRMEARIEAEAERRQAAELWVSTYILLGLRFPKPFAAGLLQGVRAMRESSTYQAILEEGAIRGREEGRAEEARRVLLLQGVVRFGEPDAAVRAALEARSSVDELERLAMRLLQVESWQELLGS